MKDVKRPLKNWRVFILIMLMAVVTESFMWVKRSEDKKEKTEVLWEPLVEVVNSDIAETSWCDYFYIPG